MPGSHPRHERLRRLASLWARLQDQQMSPGNRHIQPALTEERVEDTQHDAEEAEVADKIGHIGQDALCEIKHMREQ